MRRLILLISILSLPACGSIVRGTKEDVSIRTTPSTAVVTTSNGFNCTGSCTIKVPRKDEFSVTAAAPGYRTETVEVKTEVSGGGAASMAGNVLAGGIIGVGVDAATGASLDHTPNPVIIDLEREGAPQADDAPPAAPAGRGSATPVS